MMIQKKGLVWLHIRVKDEKSNKLWRRSPPYFVPKSAVLTGHFRPSPVVSSWLLEVYEGKRNGVPAGTIARARALSHPVPEF